MEREIQRILKRLDKLERFQKTLRTRPNYLKKYKSQLSPIPEETSDTWTNLCVVPWVILGMYWFAFLRNP